MKANAILKVDDVNGNEIKKSLPNVNPLYVPKYDEDINSDKAAKVKAACQALNALTTNTFKALDLESTADITDARTLNPAELTLDPSFGWYDSIDGIQESTKIVNSYSWNVQTMSGGAPYARVVSGDASALKLKMFTLLTIPLSNLLILVIPLSIFKTSAVILPLMPLIPTLIIP